MRIQLGVTLLATMATAAVLVAAAPASSSIAWSETAKVHGQPVLSFQVTALTVGKQGWSAHISFRNLTKHTVQVGTSFGLAFYPSSKITPATRPEAFGVATKFSHRLAAALRPGKSWSGTISGPGRPKLNGKHWARVVFGPFMGVPGNLKVFVWVTDHSLPLTLGKKGSGGGGLVI